MIATRVHVFATQIQNRLKWTASADLVSDTVSRVIVAGAEGSGKLTLMDHIMRSTMKPEIQTGMQEVRLYSYSPIRIVCTRALLSSGCTCNFYF